MKDKKEHLTEENYQKGVTLLKRLAFIVFVVGFIIGGTLITVGYIKTSEIKRQNEQAISEANKNVRTKDVIQKEIDETQEKISTLDAEINSLRTERDSYLMEDYSLSDRWKEKDAQINAKETEKTNLQKKLQNLKNELWQVTSGYNDAKDLINKGIGDISSRRYYYLYFLGGFIIIGSLMGTTALYLYSKKREILVFNMQQVMPVAKEGIEKITPTVSDAAGSVAGSVAKNVTKGIKEGLESDNKNK